MARKRKGLVEFDPYDEDGEFGDNVYRNTEGNTIESNCYKAKYSHDLIEILTLARKLLAPAGQIVILHRDEQFAYEEDEEPFDELDEDEDDETFHNGLVHEFLIMVDEAQLAHAEDHLDEFRAAVREIRGWRGMPFGVTIETLDFENA